MVLLETVAGDQVDPLLVTQRYGRGSTWMLATATTWRWQMRLPLADLRHEQFWQQLLHGLAAPAPTQMSLTAERSLYEDDGGMRLDAEILDEAFKPQKDVTLEVNSTAEDGSVATTTVEPSGRDDGRYAVRVQAPGPGLYRVELVARQGDKELARRVSHLRREDGLREKFAAYQHRALLERIAKDTGGRYWQLSDLDELPEAIRYSRAGMVERQTIDLWNIPLVFLTLVLLKTAEWLLRRRWRRL